MVGKTEKSQIIWLLLIWVTWHSPEFKETETELIGTLGKSPLIEILG